MSAKYTFAALLVTAVSLFSAYVSLGMLADARDEIRQEREKNQALSLEVTALRVSNALKRELQETRKNNKSEAKEAINDGIKADPDWASSTAPRDVTDGMCKFVRCDGP